MTYDDLTATQKRWYNALYDVTGGDFSPAAAAALYPDPCG